MGTRDFTVWIHDAKGDRQLSSEGNAYEARFSQDGSQLYYMQDNGQNSGVDLVVMELASGKTERLVSSSAVLPGSEMENYDVSHDGKQVAFSLRDQQGISHMWLSPTDHRSSPHELISATSQDSPFFLPDGDLLLRSAEGGQNFAYRTSQDGTKRQKVIPEPVLELRSISPDGRWLVAATTRADAEHETAIRVYPVDGGPPVFLCASLCENHWDASGKFFYFNPRPGGAGKTYVLPVNPARGLPNFLPMATSPGTSQRLTSGLSPSRPKSIRPRARACTPIRARAQSGISIASRCPSSYQRIRPTAALLLS